LENLTQTHFVHKGCPFHRFGGVRVACVAGRRQEVAIAIRHDKIEIAHKPVGAVARIWCGGRNGLQDRHPVLHSVAGVQVDVSKTDAALACTQFHLGRPTRADFGPDRRDE
jgi:hypothetical protein